jgi:peptidoglycan/LPS O-acetylase OafA/YrhL
VKARAEGVAGHLAGALRHSANLDWLRTLAVAAVVVDHTAETLGARWGWAAWSGVGEHGSGAAAHWGGAHAQWMALAGPLGMAGVMAFFVHTSLVLLYSLERMGRGEKRAVRFYVRRIFRIYPLAMVVIVAMVALRLPRMPGMAYVAVTRAQLASNLLLVQNLSRTPSVMGSLWSLPLEVQMYVLLPALYVVARMRAGAAYVAAMMAGVMVLGVAWGIPAGHFMSAVFVPCFLAGVLCYALRDKVRAVLPGWMWVPAVAAMMALYCVLNARYEGATARALTDWGLCLALGLAINASRDSEAVAANRVA